MTSASSRGLALVISAGSLTLLAEGSSGSGSTSWRLSPCAAGLRADSPVRGMYWHLTRSKVIPLVERVTTAGRSHMRGTLKRAVWLLLTAMGLFVVAVFIGGAFVASQDSSPSTSVAASSFSMEVYWIMLAAAFPAVWLASET